MCAVTVPLTPGAAARRFRVGAGPGVCAVPVRVQTHEGRSRTHTALKTQVASHPHTRDSVGSQTAGISCGLSGAGTRVCVWGLSSDKRDRGPRVWRGSGRQGCDCGPLPWVRSKVLPAGGGGPAGGPGERPCRRAALLPPEREPPQREFPVRPRRDPRGSRLPRGWTRRRGRASLALCP